MKYASAMKYGGELVDAQDCTYDSFKELVPLCPNCKEPVFLRTGGQRESVKGKAYQIGPHWCHFKGISDEQVAGCELRVNGYTEKDRAKIAAQARGQRLKLLQRWFWEVFSHSRQGHNSTMKYKLARLDEMLKHEEIVWQIDKLAIHLSAALRYANSNGLLSKGVDVWAESCKEQMQSNAYEFYHNVSDASLDIEECKAQYVSMFFDSFNLGGESLHLNQVKEVLSFLCSKRQNALLEDVMKVYASSVLYLGIQNKHTDDWKSISAILSDKPGAQASILDTFIQWIWFIPWASEFQRLEAEANQRRGAA